MCSIGQDLSKALAQPLVIVGVGNPMRGDDGFGPALAERLAGQGFNATVINAETAPENYLGRIASLRPAAVLIVDAVNFGGRPGELRLIDPKDVVHTGESTHAASLALIEQFLSDSCEDTRTVVLAVQPKSIGFGQEMSKEVSDAIDNAEKVIKAYLETM